MPDPALRAELAAGCQKLEVDVSPAQLDLLCEYLALLAKWNRAYNLTAVRDPAEMVRKHLLDSLAIAPLVLGQRLIDVGTGGGLPGVPLSILYPQREFHLLDSNSKKTRFLFQVKTALGLDNMTVHHARVESFQPEALFDTVLSRAFASLQDMVSGCRHLLADGGHFQAMKGIFPETEIADLAGVCEILAVTPLEVPGLAEQRHLVDMRLLSPGAS
ncbi:16S rRNA (guanine(527)-N(7))-methyltransferase RsmG [Parahaliea maris]|uniref:Ribosomal RNA small subunit methyltransferase G n=1 Tax=Parahaliea maris TaxID=2716870 RepID=A0A5C9A330_9GAMM|nr:16S rRNA (guanine(527)-N(7))-methyltransferase RsmG [Parahaliea maris]TXS93741.1 16S rRNA (guanine(527)-N(7))-methyltransferase RsmG [Parahaliea maris]